MHYPVSRTKLVIWEIGTLIGTHDTMFFDFLKEKNPTFLFIPIIKFCEMIRTVIQAESVQNEIMVNLSSY